jgi:hypothetical protein
MDPEDRVETNPEKNYCPECGAEENGYFCRKCGTLLRGEEMILCPRCHQVVPDAEYCNRCGQSLGGIALNLQQLALAGDDFWVSARSQQPADDTGIGLFEPDDSVVLADAELPDWLQELPKSVPPDVEARIYPSLQPIHTQRQEMGQPARFWAPFILLTMLTFLGLVLTILLVLLRGG